MGMGSNCMRSSDSSAKGIESFRNEIIVGTIVFTICFLSAMIPKMFKKIKNAGSYFMMINIGIHGLNLGNICYDIIPEMTQDHEHLNRAPYSLIGFTIIGLLFIESLAVTGECGHHHHHDESKKNEQDQNQGKGENKGEHEIEKTIDVSHDDDFGLDHLSSITKAKNSFSAIMFLVAISLHSTFEGLATNCGHLMSSHTIGLMLHKGAESMSVGLALLNSQLPSKIATFLIFFYCTLTPLSFFIGKYVQTGFEASHNYLTSLSLGSLIYVVCIEGIAHAMHTKKKKTCILFLLIGYLLSIAFIKMTHEH